MKAVIQRVKSTSVKVDGKTVGQIDQGLLVYLGVTETDTEKDARFIAEKLTNLRIFPDTAGKMNLSVTDIAGAILIISNFTLYGNCQKGRRPGFDAAAEPAKAELLYEKTIELIKQQNIDTEPIGGEPGTETATGQFGQYMQVESVNDGPVTFILESPKIWPNTRT